MKSSSISTPNSPVFLRSESLQKDDSSGTAPTNANGPSDTTKGPSPLGRVHFLDNGYGYVVLGALLALFALGLFGYWQLKNENLALRSQLLVHAEIIDSLQAGQGRISANQNVLSSVFILTGEIKNTAGRRVRPKDISSLTIDETPITVESDGTFSYYFLKNKPTKRNATIKIESSVYQDEKINLTLSPGHRVSRIVTLEYR